MSEIINYKNVIECYPVLEREYKKKNKKIPNMNIVCIEKYISELGRKNNYLEDISEEVNRIRELVCLEKKYIYLCIISSKNTESIAVKKYYKLWKVLKEEYDINNWELGYEYEMQLNDELWYAGCAKLDYSYLNIAIEILHHYKYHSRAFIYVTSNNTLLSEYGTKSFFEEIGNEKIKKIRDDSFDYANLFCLMDKGDFCINISNDGEKTSLFLAQKQS